MLLAIWTFSIGYLLGNAGGQRPRRPPPGAPVGPLILCLALLPGCAALPALSAALGIAAPVLDASLNAYTAEQRARAAALAPGLPPEDPAITALALRLAALEQAQRGAATVPPTEAFAALREYAQIVNLLAGELRVAQEKAAAPSSSAPSVLPAPPVASSP